LPIIYDLNEINLDNNKQNLIQSGIIVRGICPQFTQGKSQDGYNEKVLKAYKSKAKNFYCAGDKSKDVISKYGAILMKCDILKKEISINLEGNAYPIYEEAEVE